MQRWSTRLLSIALLLVMVGCAAQRQLDAGDAAAASGDMHGALYHYQRAMGLDQSLARDKSFMSRLAVAEARVAYDRAIELREQGDYEKAIEQLRLSIERDPAYAPPRELLPKVNIEASRVRYVRAVESADQGELGQARLHLERALQQDMHNEQASAALVSLAPERLPADTPGLVTYRAGLKLSSDRRWPEAQAAYSRAVAEGPGLLPARAELHNARTQLERSRKYADQGAERINARQIGPAIDALSLSLEVWPFNETAQGSLNQARQLRSAADAKLQASADLAGQRQWEEAIAMAQSGLAIDQSHAGLQQSLRQFSGMAAADYEDQGDALLAAKQLIEAEQAYARAVELEPGLKSAAISLREAHGRLDRARSLMVAGRGHIDALQMAGAIEVLNQSLAIWPFNDQSQALLDHATKQQRLAGERYEAAATSADGGAWDQAIAQADEALALDRSYAGLSQLRSDLPYRAAADYNRQGAAQLSARQLDAAQQAYAKALSYAGRDEAARSGMASVYQARGAQLEAKGLLGAALLQYAAGSDYQPRHAVSESLTRVTAAVRGRVGMGVSVSVEAGRGGAIDPDQIGRSMSGVLGQYRGQGMNIGGGSPYIMNVIIGQATIDEQRVDAVNRNYDYAVPELRHNAEYDRIVDCIRHEDAVLCDRQRDYDRILHQRAEALRKAQSMNPGPAPKKPAGPPVKQPNQDDAQYQQQLQQYQAALAQYESELAVWEPKRHAYGLAIVHYKGLGPTKDRIYSALSSQQRTLNDLKHKLAHTPHHIEVLVPQVWRYTVETYEKRGRLSVTTQIIEAATGKVIRQTEHQSSFADRDETVLNANPRIGLDEDRLNLPGDGVVRDKLTSDVARDASPWAVNAAVQHRLSLLNQRIDQLRKANDNESALEAEVDAAMLLGIVDREGSNRQIDDLAKRYAR